MPRPLEQLSALSPRVKAFVGPGLIVLGVVAISLRQDIYSGILLAVAMSLGVPLSYQAHHEGREQRRAREERARAEGELDELRLAVSEALEQKRGVERMLMDRGYESAEVRRWIARECDVVLPPVRRQ